MRYSKQRQYVYEALASTKTHPDAAWVYGEVRKRLPNISLGTVYRNLGELCEAKKAKRISVATDKERFDADVSPHAHFVCTSCDCIFDVNRENVTAEYTGSEKVEKMEIILYGVCENCAKLMKGGNKDV